MFGISIITTKRLRKLQDLSDNFLLILEKKDNTILALAKELNNNHNSQQYGIREQMHPDREKGCGTDTGQTPE